MAVPKQHRSKSRQGERRQHLFLKETRFISCAKCGKAVLPHALCSNCGAYLGKDVVDVLAKLSKKEQKAKTKEIQEGGTQELSAEKLSRA